MAVDPTISLNEATSAGNDLLRARLKLEKDIYRVMDASRVLLSERTKTLVTQVQIGSDQIKAAREEMRLKTPALNIAAKMAQLKLQELKSAKMSLDIAKMSASVSSAALTDIQSAYDDAKEAYDLHRGSAVQIAAQLKSARELEKAYKSNRIELAKNGIYHVVEGADSLVEVFKTLTHGPLIAFVQLIKLAFDRFVELDKAAENFRRTTGLTINQTRELRKNAEDINLKYRDMGVSIEQANKATMSLVDSFGGMALAGKESVATTALLAENLGVSAENTADVLAQFQGLGGLSEKVANNMLKGALAMTKNTPVSFAKVMEDIAKSSDEVHHLLGSNPQLLMKTAIQARALGASINSVASSSKKLLDFSSSINSEMEATALLGVTVNLQRARQLAFEGKLADSAKESLRVVKRAGDWNKMNVFQREALAKATGMELKDLNKMVALDRLRNSGTAEGEKLKALDAQLAVMDNINMSAEEKLLKDAEEEIKQRQIQGVMTNLSSMLKSIFLEMATVLTPVVKVLVTAIVPALKVVGILVKTIGVLLSPIGDLFEWIDKHVGSTEGMLNRVSGWLDNIRDASSGWAMFAKSIAASALLYLAYTQSAYVKKAAIFAIDKMSSRLPIPGLGKLLGKGPSIAGAGAAGLAGKATSGLAGGIGSLAKAAGTGITKVLQGISKGVESFGSPKFFKGVLGIALLGASIIPLAFALKMFTGIDWASVALGGVSLAVLAGFAAVIGNFAGQIIPGAIAMTLLGISIIPLAFALNMFGTVDWSSVMLGGVALVGLAVVAAVLGSFVPLILLGALAIAALGVALIPFAAAAMLAGMASQELGKGIGMMVTPLLEMSKIGMFKFAAGLYALSLGLIAFTGVSVIMGAAAPMLIIGSIAMTMLGSALVPLINSVQLFNGINWKSTAVGMAGLVAVAAVAAGIGVFTPMILVGSIAIMSLGAAVSIFAPAMKTLTDVNWETVAAAGKALVSFAKTAGKIGLFSPVIIAGSVAITTIGIALSVFTLAISKFSKIDWNIINRGMTSLVSLVKTAGIIGMLSPVIIAGSVALAILGMALVPFAISMSLMKDVGGTLSSLATSIQSFGNVDISSMAVAGASLLSFSLIAAGIGLLSPSILLGSVAILVVGKSLQSFATGVKVFEEVNWKSLFIGAAALGAFSLVAAGLGLISPAIIIGSLAILVLGNSLKSFSSGAKSFVGIDWKSLVVGAVALEAFSIIAAGLGFLSPAIIAGSVAILVLGTALSSFSKGAVSFTGIDWKSVLIGAAALGSFSAIAAGLGILSPAIIAGSVATLTLGFALLSFSKGAISFAGIDWKSVLIGAAALSSFSVIAAGLGLLSPAILLGSVAILALGFSLSSFSKNAISFTGIEWKSVFTGASALVAFSLVAAGLGLISPAILAGSAAISILGMSLIPFSAGAGLAGKAAVMFGDGISACIKPLIDLTKIGLSGFTDAATGIQLVSLALASFGGGAAVSGIGSLIGKISGGDPVDKLRELASLGSDLTKTATAINSITSSFAGFETVNKFAESISLLADSIDKLNKSVSSVSLLSVAKLSMTSKLQSQMPTVVPQSEPVKSDVTEKTDVKTETSSADVVSKLDELIKLLRDGAIGVNMDGHSVSKMQAAHAV